VLHYASMRMVFADDSDIVRTLIKRFLVEYDPSWEIVEAKTGREAMEKTLTTKPDLVLLDINRPDIQGTEVAKIIRESVPSVKIVLCSLGDSQDLVGAVKACGADAYISKVAPMEEFHKILAALIGTSQK
jgi:DNA-binding NarL/FixJ family response regulator